MNEILNEKKKINRLLVAFWLGHYLEKNTISLIVGSKGYADSLINRLKEKKIVEKVTKNGRAYYRLTQNQGELELRVRMNLATIDGPLVRGKKLNKTSYVTRYAKRSRSFVTFNYLGMETFVDFQPTLETIDMYLDKLVMYIDSSQIKEELGEETRGARLTGVIINKDDLYRVYAENSIFFYSETTEDRFINRVKSSTHIANDTKPTDIVLTESFANLKKFFADIHGFTGQNGQTVYKINGTRNKYLFDMKNIAIQLDLMVNGKINKVNKGIGNILQCEVSHEKFTTYKDSNIINGILPNLGLLKFVYNSCRKRTNNNLFNQQGERDKYTIVCLKTQEEYYKDAFKGKVDLITLTNDDINNLMEGE